MTHQPSSDAPAQEADAGEETYKAIRRECDEKLARFSTQYIEDERTIESLRRAEMLLNTVIDNRDATIESLRLQVAELRDNGTRLLQAADGWKLSAKYFQDEANGYERATERVIKERENLDALLQKQMDITLKEYKRAEKAEAENAALREEIRELNQMGFTHENAAAQKAALEDAERYRWFRSKRLWDADSFPWPKDFEYPEPCLWDDGEMLDAAIDAVRKK